MSFFTKIWSYTPAGLLYKHVLKPVMGGGGPSILENHHEQNDVKLGGGENADYTTWILIGAVVFVASTIGLLLYIN